MSENTATIAPAATFPTLDAAARAWGKAHRVSGRTGGYLYAADLDAYRALPSLLRVGRPEQRSKLALVESGAGIGPSGTRAVQGWASLGFALRRYGVIAAVRVDGYVRYHVALPAAPAA
jgi:hypothetical protein